MGADSFSLLCDLGVLKCKVMLKWQFTLHPSCNIDLACNKHIFHIQTLTIVQSKLELDTRMLQFK